MIERRRSTNIANGILSAIVLACGILLSVLVALLFKKVFEGIGINTYSTYSAYNTSPVWVVGFAFIVPGLIGVIASLVGAKGGFIAQMIFCILTLVIMGIFFVIGILALWAMSLFTTSSGCTAVGNTCTCIGSVASTSCEDLNTIAGMSIGSTVMIVLGWIACLIATITGGILACSRETPGAVVNHYGQPGTGVPMGYVAAPQSGYVVQPGYGGHSGYVVQQGYGGQPGYVVQQGYGGHSGRGHQGYVENSGYSVSTKHPYYHGDNRGYM